MTSSWPFFFPFSLTAVTAIYNLGYFLVFTKPAEARSAGGLICHRSDTSNQIRACRTLYQDWRALHTPLICFFFSRSTPLGSVGIKEISNVQFRDMIEMAFTVCPCCEREGMAGCTVVTWCCSCSFSVVLFHFIVVMYYHSHYHATPQTYDVRHHAIMRWRLLGCRPFPTRRACRSC